MRRSGKIFVVGCCVSAGVAGLGVLNTHRLAERTTALETQCRASDVPDKDQPPWKAAGSLVCDANDLDGLSGTEGIQATIVQAHLNELSSREGPLLVALVVLGLSAVPWLWYALLRRIGELRAAIGGNPPER